MDQGPDHALGRGVQFTKSDQKVISLTPMTDMTGLQGSYIPNMGFLVLNHKASNNGIFCCHTLDSVQAGSRVTVLAQNSGSLFYFKEHGWIPENFPVWSEMYSLELGMSTSDALYERKKEILKKFKIPMSVPMLFRIKPELFNTDIEMKSNQISFDGLFSFIRILQGNEGIFYTFDDA